MFSSLVYGPYSSTSSVFSLTSLNVAQYHSSMYRYKKRSFRKNLWDGRPCGHFLKRL